MIIIIGVDVDEVDHARAGLMRPRSGEPQALRPARERSAPDPRQNPMPRDPQDPLDQPAGTAPGHQEVGDDGKPAGQPCPHLEPRKDPVTRRQPVILDEGGLGLEHQARDIHARRTFGLAELAMDAEAGVGLEFLASPELGIDLPGGDLPDQIGLGTGRRRLTAVSTIARAHAQSRIQVTAFAAAVAGRGHRQCAGLRPAQNRQDHRAVASRQLVLPCRRARFLARLRTRVSASMTRNEPEPVAVPGPAE